MISSSNFEGVLFTMNLKKTTLIILFISSALLFRYLFTNFEALVWLRDGLFTGAGMFIFGLSTYVNCPVKTSKGKVFRWMATFLVSISYLLLILFHWIFIIPFVLIPLFAYRIPKSFEAHLDSPTKSKKVVEK